MKQQTWSDIEYSKRKKKTKREEFLEMMEEIILCILWEEGVKMIRPYYPKGERGRPPIKLESMLWCTAIPAIWESRNERKWQTTSICPRLCIVSTFAPADSPR